jgi:hypothetical protein
MFNSVIAELYASKEVDECISKMVREDLRKDFKQELFLIICTQPEEKIIELHRKSELRYFVVRIIINLASQNRNVFHKKYLQTYSEIGEIADEQVPDREGYLKKLTDEFSKIDDHFGTFCHRVMIELVLKMGSVKKVSEETGIPKRTIYRTIETTRKHLKKVLA